MTDQPTTNTDQPLATYRPGPYRYYRDADGCDDLWCIIAEGNDRPMVTIPFWDCDPAWMARAEAQARLFTAAPELVDALRALLKAIGGLPITILPGEFFDARFKASRLIAQVEGRL